MKKIWLLDTPRCSNSTQIQNTDEAHHTGEICKPVGESGMQCAKDLFLGATQHHSAPSINEATRSPAVHQLRPCQLGSSNRHQGVEQLWSAPMERRFDSWLLHRLPILYCQGHSGVHPSSQLVRRLRQDDLEFQVSRSNLLRQHVKHKLKRNLHAHRDLPWTFSPSSDYSSSSVLWT